MSEWEAHVFCTCFQDGLTGEPPLPRAELTVNEFGVVTVVGSEDHSEDPDVLWLWRMAVEAWEELDGISQPCIHEEMRLVSEIFSWPGSGAHAVGYPTAERLVKGAAFPLLRELFRRPSGCEYASGGTWITAEETGPLLQEIRRLRPLVSGKLPDDHFIPTLETLVRASHETGNPVITFYNGIAEGAW